jgi:acyl carrier protein
MRLEQVPNRADDRGLRERLLALPPAEAMGLLRETLAAELGRILRLPGGAVPVDAPLAGLGLDSLGGMELRVGLEQRLGMPVPLTAVTDTLTVDSLARKLADQLQGQGAGGEVPADAAALMAAHEGGAATPEAVERAA